MDEGITPKVEKTTGANIIHVAELDSYLRTVVTRHVSAS